MKASENWLYELLRATKAQYTIPVYQRPYSWSRSQCQTLWSDLLEMSKPQRRSHFLGAVVYIHGAEPMAKVNRHLVIDGQQRLTTVTILLIALRDHLIKAGDTPDITSDEIHDDYLTNRNVKGDDRYKLVLTEGDRRTLTSLIDKTPIPERYSARVIEAYEYFSDELTRSGISADRVHASIRQLSVVEVVLDSKEDDAQLIFESLNSTGLALSQSDLIRNYILMQSERDRQEYMYMNYWRVMEDRFGQANYAKYFNAYIRHYLTLRLNRIPKIDNVYQEFKAFFTESGKSVESIAQDLEKMSRYYIKIALGADSDKKLQARFARLVELETNVAIPFLLQVYEDLDAQLLTTDDFAYILDLIESFVIRRSICDIAANVLNKMFLAFSKSIRKDTYRESVSAEFRLLTGSARFPSDAEFRAALVRKDIYNLTKRRTFILRRLINNPAPEAILLDSVSIEHIMPQNPNLSAEWQADLGPDWQRVQSTYLHTIGNLTLTGHNSSLGDNSFKAKLDAPHGFRKSAFIRNHQLAEYERWDESAIRDRADRLAQDALHIWPFPSIGTETLAKYRKTGISDSHVAVEEHFPTDTPLKQIWATLRSDILEIDPIVTEEIFKTYIAYKAITNFVDIHPTSAALVLTLNIEFALLDDPRQLCRDVTNVGTHGNGDAQLRLARHDDIPYAMQLIRQAFVIQTSEFRAGVAE